MRLDNHMEEGFFLSLALKEPDSLNTPTKPHQAGRESSPSPPGSNWDLILLPCATLCF